MEDACGIYKNKSNVKFYSYSTENINRVLVSEITWLNKGNYLVGEIHCSTQMWYKVTTQYPDFHERTNYCKQKRKEEF